MRGFLLMLLALIVLAILFLPVFAYMVLYKAIRGESVGDYCKAIAIGFDQAGGSILYGEEDFTVSSWTYYLCNKGIRCWFMKFIDLLFGKNHCRDSFYKEIGEMVKNENIA